MRLSIAVALLAAGIVLQTVPSRAHEQVVEPLNPAEEQRIEVISGGEAFDDGSGQRVHPVGGEVEQTVGEHIPPTPSEKAASKAGKFVMGVASAGLALGVMAASLLLL